jgi:hypothetical protein
LLDREGPRPLARWELLVASQMLRHDRRAFRPVLATLSWPLGTLPKRSLIDAQS